jgi:hypothetical protein
LLRENFSAGGMRKTPMAAACAAEEANAMDVHWDYEALDTM